MNTIFPKAAPIARLTWIACFLAPFLIAILLLGATTASAAPPPAAANSQPSLEDEEELEEQEEEELELEEEAAEEPGWEEGWEEEELGGTDCELGHEALAEGLLSLTDVEDLCAAEREWEEEAEGRSQKAGKAQPSCALRSTRARVVTRRKRLKLMIGYTAAAPTKARIEVRAGKRRLATVRRRLGRKGVIHLNRRVGKHLSKQLGKRGGGTRVRLRIKLPRSAAACPSRRLALFAR